MIVALCVGRDAPLGLRERLAYDEAAQRELLRHATPETVLLCTCHRTELYTTHEPGPLPGMSPADLAQARILRGRDAVEHLFRVACGLDSLAPGEVQVLGQVRRALNLARAEGAAGPVLTGTFARAIEVGRRVRAQTALGTLRHSIGSAATRHLERLLGGLSGRRGVVVGAGKAALDVAGCLVAAGARLEVVNRSAAGAARIASRVGGRARPFGELAEALGDADFLVVAVSGGIAVRPEHLPPRPIVCVDLSLPRGIDAGGRPVETLDSLPQPDGPQTEAAIAAAEALLQEELARWWQERTAASAIARLRSHVVRIVEQEIARLAPADDGDAERMRLLVSRVTNKILHHPTAELRRSDPEMRELILRVLGVP